MRAYIITWGDYRWPTLQNDIQSLKNTKILSTEWTIAAHKQIQIGDRFFLMKQKLKGGNSGIVGSGYFIENPSGLCLAP